MIKKRISAAVVLKNNKVVQSFKYKQYLPQGSINTIIQNLDRWGVDDIVVLDIDRSKNQLGPNLETIRNISALPISTPLTYGGGIRSVNDALKVIDAGAERIILDNLYINQPNKIKKISAAIGSQAIIISIPFKISEGKIYHFNYLNKRSTKLDFKQIRKYGHLISELLIVDVNSQGSSGSYSSEVIEHFHSLNIGLICYGGVGMFKEGTQLLEDRSVNAIAYGNVLNYGELFFQKIKKSLNKSKQKLRRPIFREKI